MTCGSGSRACACFENTRCVVCVCCHSVLLLIISFFGVACHCRLCRYDMMSCVMIHCITSHMVWVLFYAVLQSAVLCRVSSFCVTLCCRAVLQCVEWSHAMSCYALPLSRFLELNDYETIEYVQEFYNRCCCY